MMQTTLPPAAVSARDARRFVNDALHRLGFEAHADTAALLVSELVTNAVLHAHSVLTVRVLRQSAALRVEVEDGSGLAPVQRQFSEDSATGRGLLLVEALAASWGTSPTAAGKVVWFELAAEGMG